MMEFEVTPLTAIQALTKLSRQLDDLGAKNKQLEREFVTAKHAYALANATAYLRADGSIKEREMTALLETKDLRLEADRLEAELRIVRTDIGILRTRMDVGRSTVGVLRVEAELEKAR